MEPAATLVQRAVGFVVLLISLRFVSAIYDCYDPQRKEYLGNSTELAFCVDCECLPWPEEYGFTENYCRFVEGVDVPRCLVDNYLGVHLEDCNVPSCDGHTTCYHGDGSDYQDGGRFTESGYQCLQWDAVQHLGVNGTVYPSADLRENLCRNPNGESRPWCYFFANGRVQKGFCPIPECTGSSSTHFDQLPHHTLILDTDKTAVQLVSFKPANFTVEQCLEECLNRKDFVCRSVMVDTLRRRCSLTDVNQFYISLGDSEREDLYVMRDRVCDVFEDNGLTNEECLLPLGLEVGLIADGQLTASSYANLDHAPWEGRLNGNSSWMPDPAEFNQSAPADARPYLQIDFLERVKVTGLVVQGGGGADTLSGNWVEEFTVLIAHDPVGGAWDKVGLYKDTVSQYGPALPKIFEANKEPNCVRSMFFEEAIYTRYLRINPTQWHGQVALRLEVIGCRDTDCDNTLGMINGKITDSQIAVSSYRSLTEDGRAARLTPFNGRSGIGWIPAHSDPEPTIKIQLGRPHVLTSIITQGCVARGATSLRISHVNRTAVLSPVQDEISRLEIIGGNSGTSYLYRHTLLAPVTCTSVIITLLEPDELSCFKVELVGCLSLSGCRKRLGMETGRIADHQLSTQRNRSEAGQAATATPRLHQWVGLSSGWILGENGGGDWLQIDLLTLHTVSGVMVQAGRDHQYSLWVDTYLILFAVEDSQNRETWQVYRDNHGNKMIFKGRFSPYTVSYHVLSRAFVTRKVRIAPLSWGSLFPGLRMEVIGCELAENGDFCSEDSTYYQGFCLGAIETDSPGACEAIFGHRATQVIIRTEEMQTTVGDVLRGAGSTVYLIGLRASLNETTEVYSYTWADGTKPTFTRFDLWGPSYGTGLCVEIDAIFSHWRSASCDPQHLHSRGTVCQYDLDECAGNHGCSHECINYPGGYQCQCPTGYVLDSAEGKGCVPVCSHFQSNGEAWGQHQSWCYTLGYDHVTWHEANSACLSLGLGSHLPQKDDAFWDGFFQPWNLTWVSHGTENSPCFTQSPPQVYRNPLATNCTAKDLSTSTHMDSEWLLNCNISLPFVCIIEFASIEDTSAPITVDAPFGLFRKWIYPPHLPSDVMLATLRFSVPTNYTVMFDVLRLSLPPTDGCESSFFGIFDVLSENKTTQRRLLCGNDLRNVTATGWFSDIEAVLQVTLTLDSVYPSVVGLETIFKVIGCGTNCMPYCGPSPSVLTNATGSLDILNANIDGHTRCRWLISVEKGKYVKLSLCSNLLSDNARVTVFYGNVQESDMDTTDHGISIVKDSTPGSLQSGTDNTPSLYIADSNEVTIFLTTGWLGEQFGFLIDYESVDAPGCSVGQFVCINSGQFCSIQCNYSSAYVASKGYPELHQGIGKWRWTITTLPGTFVELVFDSLNITSASRSECTAGYLQLLQRSDNEDDEIGGRLCDSRPPTGPLRSPRNHVSLEFYQGHEQEAGGFLARYQGLYYQPRREVTVTSDNCADGWFYYNKHCYRFAKEKSSIRWDDASSICEDQKATLVSIKDRDEADYVHFMLTTVWTTESQNTYIGLTNRRVEGVFLWSDRSPMTFTDWALDFTEEDEEEDERFEYNNPNGGMLEGCTMITLNDFARTSNWVDVACAAREAKQYVCKKTAEDYTRPPDISDFVGSETQRQCPSYLFQCANGECIQKILVCNSVDECSDGSDEGEVCSVDTDYSKFRFQCDGFEISASSFCDFHDDCLDAWDELTCVRPKCSESEFQCPNGKCIDKSKRCDMIDDCDGSQGTASDEVGCEVRSGGFQCYSTRWIPIEYTCDTYPDCGGLHYEDEVPCGIEYKNSCMSPNVTRCRSGICVDDSHTCLYDVDQHGYIKGCRDVTHLRNCEDFQCPVMMFKCPDSYCIPLRFRCNDVGDCPDKEDENNCGQFVCPGAYRCRNNRTCVTLEELCDGKPDCPEMEDDPGGDDELFCNVTCPNGCECVGFSYLCENVKWEQRSASMISPSTRQLFLTAVGSTGAPEVDGFVRAKRDQISGPWTVMNSLHLDLKEFPFLVELELTKNSIDELVPGMFNESRNLRHLNLSFNNIDVLRSGTFEGLSSLEHLTLSFNPLSTIEIGAFAGLNNLKTLEVEGVGQFKSKEGFEDLESLQTIIASKYHYCCVRDVQECFAPRDQFSDCDDLISNGALRFFIWLLGLSALVGNVLVFGLRMVRRYRPGRGRTQRQIATVQDFLITNLAASDFLMGVYMLTIAGADMHFRGVYAFRSEGWRASLACTVTGLLAVLSSEVSVFIVMLLSLDRFLKIVFPFRFGLHMTLNRTRILVVASWAVGLLMSLLPAVVSDRFSDAYYGSSSVCLALPLVPVLPNGWRYMFFLLSVNLICFLGMFVCYAAIFVAVKRSSREAQGQSAQRAAEVRVAAKMSLIVGTDFACWMPIILLALLASFAKVDVPQGVYAWIAIFILPLNSSINPYLYTLSNFWGKRKNKKSKRLSSLIQNQDHSASASPMSRTRSSTVGMESFSDSHSIDFELKPVLATVFSQLEQHRIVPLLNAEALKAFSNTKDSANSSIPGSGQNLGTNLTVWNFTEEELKRVEEDISEALSWLHANGIAGIQLNKDSILLHRESRGCQRAYLKLPQSIVTAEMPNCKQRDDADDIGVELDNKAWENLKRRLRKHVGLGLDEKAQTENGSMCAMSRL